MAAARTRTMTVTRVARSRGTASARRCSMVRRSRSVTLAFALLALPTVGFAQAGERRPETVDAASESASRFRLLERAQAAHLAGDERTALDLALRASRIAAGMTISV